MTRPSRNSKRRDRSRSSIRRATKTVTVNSYWQLPARLFDDSEELADWARAALAAAQRAALRKRPKARKAAKPKVAKKAASKPAVGRKPAAKRPAAKARKAPRR